MALSPDQVQEFFDFCANFDDFELPSEDEYDSPDGTMSSFISSGSSTSATSTPSPPPPPNTPSGETTETETEFEPESEDIFTEDDIPNLLGYQTPFRPPPIIIPTTSSSRTTTEPEFDNVQSYQTPQQTPSENRQGNPPRVPLKTLFLNKNIKRSSPLGKIFNSNRKIYKPFEVYIDQ